MGFQRSYSDGAKGIPPKFQLFTDQINSNGPISDFGGCLPVQVYQVRTSINPTKTIQMAHLEILADAYPFRYARTRTSSNQIK